MLLSIIIVNYRSYTHLLNCLKSINDFLYKSSVLKNNFEVILVNNEKKDLTISTNYPFINQKVVNVGKNVGFGTAHNLGSIMARGQYLFFLNPDTVFLDNSLIRALNYIKKCSNFGALGLKIIDNDRKSTQNWICGKKTNWGNILLRNTINKPWNKKTPQEVSWTSGTALIIKKTLFKKIHGFDKNFFMYFEDQDICLRIKSLNKKIIYYPQAKILHFNGKSWKNKQKQKVAYQNSQLYFFKKYNTLVGYFILKILYKIKNLF